MTAGSELKQAREDAGLTQEQVADELGVSRVTVTLWEGKAEVKKPKADRFLKAVAALSKAAA
jgi:transcriptional regulator with XRE-family HTH domain